MATQILPTASGAADSSDVVVADGSSLAVRLKGAIGNALVIVWLKDDAGAYHQIGKLTDAEPATALIAPGSYRFSRRAGTCGVFSG